MIEIPEGWQLMPYNLGPPLPRSMEIYWPWVTPPAPPEVAPPEVALPPPPPPPGVPPTPKYRLYVYTVGKGTVSPTDDEYWAGSVVTLTARPGAGAVFNHWAGDASGTSPMFNITMDRSKSATAYFSTVPFEEAPPGEEIPPVPGVADIRLENLTIEPSEVYIGDRVTIGLAAKNYGTASGSKVITCDINGQVSRQTVTLAINESKSVTFSGTPKEARTYQVSVNGLTGSFKAIAKPPLPPEEALYAPRMRVVATPLDTKLYRVTFSTDITNRSSQPVEAQLIWGTNYGLAEAAKGLGWQEEVSRIVTIQPWETYHWSYEMEDDIEDYYKGYLRCQLYVDGKLLSEGKWL